MSKYLNMRWLWVFIVLGVILVLPVLPVHAQDTDPGSSEGDLGLLYRKAYGDLQWLGIRIRSAQHYSQSYQGWILKQSQKGRDTAGLEAARVAFDNSIETIVAVHDSVHAALLDHAGFDDSLNITDPLQAELTVRSARDAIRDAQQSLEKAYLELPWEARYIGFNENFVNTIWRITQVAQQEAIENMNRQLIYAHGLLDQANAKCNSLKAQGEATTSFEDALRIYSQWLGEAQGFYDQASQARSANLGFDEEGIVTDVQQAERTRAVVRIYLSAAQTLLTQSTLGLERLLK